MEEIPFWNKYLLTLNESSKYFNIGENTLRKFISEHENEDFLISIGNKKLIKRKMFEQYIDTHITVMWRDILILEPLFDRIEYHI